MLYVLINTNLRGHFCDVLWPVHLREDSFKKTACLFPECVQLCVVYICFKYTVQHSN